MSVAHLIDLFLRRFREWNWPVPVALQDVLPNSKNAWNPTFNLNHRQDIMPIITPCFPQANTTAKVLPSIVGIFQKELEDGLKRLERGWGAFFSPREESEPSEAQPGPSSKRPREDETETGPSSKRTRSSNGMYMTQMKLIKKVSLKFLSFSPRSTIRRVLGGKRNGKCPNWI